MNFFRHLRTINRHRRLVRKGCFKIGLYYQGLTHDLSKYSPTEFWCGVKYYQGTRSPNNAQREDIGYSAAWLHHKGRNKHHYEYWIDYSLENADGTMFPVSMPNRYIAEMVMDRIAAAKVYWGSKYTDSSPLQYYKKSEERIIIHPETKRKLEYLLEYLSNNGEKALYEHIKKEFLKKDEKDN
ncbi:MAG: DUF5662 family protein [Lachnospiraceae bacterium]|nr:DUF5662 family protein [Lachnospiraceae bacterium]